MTQREETLQRLQGQVAVQTNAWATVHEERDGDGQVREETDRLKAPGGWVYRTRVYAPGELLTHLATCYVPTVGR